MAAFEDLYALMGMKKFSILDDDPMNEQSEVGACCEPASATRNKAAAERARKAALGRGFGRYESMNGDESIPEAPAAEPIVRVECMPSPTGEVVISFVFR